MSLKGKVKYIFGVVLAGLNLAVWTRHASSSDVGVDLGQTGLDDNPPVAGTSTSVSKIDEVIYDTESFIRRPKSQSTKSEDKLDLMKKSERQDYIAFEAYEMARSGRFRDYTEIERALRAQGFEEAREELDRPSVRKELDEVCRAAQKSSEDGG